VDRTPFFLGQNPGEESIIHWRHHWLILLWRISPLLLLIIAAMAAVTDLAFYLPAWQSGIIVVFFCVLCIPLYFRALQMAYDWWDDEFILTNERLIHIERIIQIEWRKGWRKTQLSKIHNMAVKILNLIANIFVLSAEQHEAQLSKIQDVTFRIPTFIASIFNIGSLIVEMSGSEGMIFLDYIYDPRSIQEKILELRGLPMPAQPATRKAFLYGNKNVFPFAPIREGATVIWHKHWFILLRAIALPLFMVVSLVMLLNWSWTAPQIFISLGISAEFVQMVLSFLLVYFSLVFFWRYIEWWNNIYVITEDRIIQIERIPYIYEGRREAYLERIRDLQYAIPSLLYRILGLGNVFIETTDRAVNFLFEQVPNPAQIMEEIISHLEHLWTVRLEPVRLDLLHLETLREISEVHQKLAWLPADRGTLPGDAPEAIRRLEVVGTEVAAALAPVSRRERDEHLATAHKGLEDFQRFAAVGRGTQGFIEVAERWQGILERQAVQLQAIPNPFVAGPPLIAGSPLFVGREDIRVYRKIRHYVEIDLRHGPHCPFRCIVAE